MWYFLAPPQVALRFARPRAVCRWKCSCYYKAQPWSVTVVINVGYAICVCPARLDIRCTPDKLRGSAINDSSSYVQQCVTYDTRCYYVAILFAERGESHVLDKSSADSFDFVICSSIAISTIVLRPRVSIIYGVSLFVGNFNLSWISESCHRWEITNDSRITT